MVMTGESTPSTGQCTCWTRCYYDTGNSKILQSSVGGFTVIWDDHQWSKMDHKGRLGILSSISTHMHPCVLLQCAKTYRYDSCGMTQCVHVRRIALSTDVT